MSARFLLTLGVLLASGASSGCDNPACVFAGTCQDLDPGSNPDGPAGGLGEGTIPSEGAILTPQAPTLVSAAPTDDGGPANLFNDMPVFVEFSESLDPDSIDGAFVLFDSLIGQPFPVLSPLLVGDGRVVVLFPQGLSTGRTYQLFFDEEQEIRDLNGQAFEADPNLEITRFTVNVDGTSASQREPRAFYVYPNDGSTTNSDSSEIVVGFDQRINVGTLTTSSFSVTVDGVAPAFDPTPSPLTVFGVSDSRVLRWQSRDTNGRVVPYGTDAQVELELSPNGARILAEEGGELPLTLSEFNTVEFSLPSEVRKPAGSVPENAYGRADVFGQSTVLEVSFASPAVPSSALEFYLFGTSPSNNTVLRSTFATVDLPEGTSSIRLTPEELGLVDGLGDPQFLDGELVIGVGVRRDTLRSGVRLLDADPSTDQVDTFLFDTTAPTLLGLGGRGLTSDSFSSSVSDLVIAGRASEPIAFAFVDAGGLGTNGGSTLEPPQTVFTRADPGTDEAIFVCAPVVTGLLDPNGAAANFDLFIYDAALNAAPVGAVGVFDHRGIVGPGGSPTGGNVQVRVLDADTLAPISGAVVYSHQESGGAVSFVASASSDTTGRVTVAGAAADNTVITAEASGYDITSFHGVPRDATDILLRRSALSRSGVSGSVQGEFPSGNFDMAQNQVADTRASRRQRLTATNGGGLDQSLGLYDYPFGPVEVRPDTLGALSYLGTTPALPEVGFSALLFLQGFAVEGPLAPLDDGVEALDLTVDAGTQLQVSDFSLRPIDLPIQVFSTAAASGLGVVAAAPEFTVEAAATGLDGPLVVGGGIAYDQGGGAYNVRGALAGLASPAGDLVARGAIEADVFLRARATDAAGNEVVARPRLSGAGGVLTPIGVPQLLNPAPGGNSGSLGFNMLVADTLADGTATDGVVQVVLTDGNGRTWTIWGLDTDDVAGNLLLSVPDLAAQGGTGLQAGAVSAEVTLWGGDFDRGNFLYSDLERLHTVMGYAAPVTFLVP